MEGGLDSYFLRRDCAAMGAELTAAGAGSATLGASVSLYVILDVNMVNVLDQTNASVMQDIQEKHATKISMSVD